MSREQFKTVMDMLPSDDRGLYWHSLHRFTNGRISLTKKGAVKVPLEISLSEIGAKRDDICAVFLPSCANNDLVPLLVFVDPKKFLETQPLPVRPLVAAGHFEMTPNGRREVSKVFADSADVEILYHDPEWPFHSSPKVDALRKEIEGLNEKLQHIQSRLSDDAFAISFQTFGQYRTALIKELKGGAA